MGTHIAEGPWRAVSPPVARQPAVREQTSFIFPPTRGCPSSACCCKRLGGPKGLEAVGPNADRPSLMTLPFRYIEARHPPRPARRAMEEPPAAAPAPPSPAGALPPALAGQRPVEFLRLRAVTNKRPPPAGQYSVGFLRLRGPGPGRNNELATLIAESGWDEASRFARFFR